MMHEQSGTHRTTGIPWGGRHKHLIQSQALLERVDEHGVLKQPPAQTNFVDPVLLPKRLDDGDDCLSTDVLNGCCQGNPLLVAQLRVLFSYSNSPVKLRRQHKVPTGSLGKIAVINAGQAVSVFS